MKDETSLFARKRAVPEGLLAYGFGVEADGTFHCRTSLLGGCFVLEVCITSEPASVYTELVDTESGCEYVLHNVPGAEGEFVGAVRQAYYAALADIRDKCFIDDVFKSPDARAVIKYASERYGDKLEFLWKKLPIAAVLRRKDSHKWYAIIMVVKRCKVGRVGGEMIEIIDLRMPRDQAPQIIDNVRYLPGYHMNKKTWMTICLDGSVPTEEICRNLDHSYDLAK
ncbi:MAG: MmcQ/YjbR family DNA-binding protein [Alphaproteobacteria bacterium]|nr:MmcQ/YjbR family DNA-binding protein [Alphaproteobacteria bacterium]